MELEDFYWAWIRFFFLKKIVEWKKFECNDLEMNGLDSRKHSRSMRAWKIDWRRFLKMIIAGNWVYNSFTKCLIMRTSICSRTVCTFFFNDFQQLDYVDLFKQNLVKSWSKSKMRECSLLFIFIIIAATLHKAAAAIALMGPKVTKRRSGKRW